MESTPAPNAATFADLPAHVQEKIRQKQKARKEAARARKAVPSAPAPAAAAAASGAAAAAGTAEFPSRITMDEYFDACPFGKFGDPAIRANDEGVALLMHLVGQRQIIGSDPRDGSGVTLAQFNYFTFAGGDEQVWSASLYARLAYEGFFTITQQGGSKPLPELQPFYSVVDWHNFARSRHVRRALQRMRRKMAPPTCGLRVPDEGGGEGLGGDGSGGGESGREIVSEHADGDACFELVCARGAHDVWRAIDDYHTRTQGSNWLTRKYLGVMQRASEDPGINFTLHAIELHRCSI